MELPNRPYNNFFNSACCESIFWSSFVNWSSCFCNFSILTSQNTVASSSLVSKNVSPCNIIIDGVVDDTLLLLPIMSWSSSSSSFVEGPIISSVQASSKPSSSFWKWHENKGMKWIRMDSWNCHFAGGCRQKQKVLPWFVPVRNWYLVDAHSVLQIDWSYLDLHDELHCHFHLLLRSYCFCCLCWRLLCQKMLPGTGPTWWVVRCAVRPHQTGIERRKIFFFTEQMRLMTHVSSPGVDSEKAGFPRRGHFTPWFVSLCGTKNKVFIATVCVSPVESIYTFVSNENHPNSSITTYYTPIYLYSESEER